ncbi:MULTISPECIES: autotransporter domain-containing protein [unclassified Brevundimonas]|uniref:autotransporter domain-containing protein n=1 Tax=unclassified Brevundimonas TaxID=2622653 RepID=UPI0025C3866B|nr:MULTISPECIES: autotransporter domain-containing protein [unclassified Brevundimonas]
MKALMTGAASTALAVALVAIAGSASAQTYDRLVVFGDSLSDNGNLYGATNGAQPASPPYWQGRFSDGRTFAEQLGFTAANFNGPVTGSINLAFGGARTDSQAAPLGMQLQLASYVSRGGRFGAGDLVSVLGGANNIFQGLPVAGASANPTGTIAVTSRSAASDISGLVGAVAQAGAGTIVVTNLPRLSVTPQFRGTAAAPLADFAVTTFNTALYNNLASVASSNPGANIIQVDLFTAGDALSANPEAFGIRNATQACFNGVTVCSNPGEYFYFDGVHPTTKGHSIIASMVNDYIYYGTAGSRMAVLGETSWRHREDDLDSATRELSTRDAWGEGTRLSLSALASTAKTDARGAIEETKTDGYGARLALETGNETLRFGLAGGIRQSELDAGIVKADIDNFSLDVYGGWRSERAFVNVAAGAAQDDYNNVQRMTALAPLVHNSSTRGKSYGARAQGGMWFEQGRMGISPRVAVAWVNTSVDSFFEAGPVADYAYQSRRLEAITGEVALRLEHGTERVQFFIEGGWRDSLSDSSEDMRTGIQGNTAKVLAQSVDLPYGSQGIVSVGLSGRIGENLSVGVGYNGRFGSDFNSHLGGVRLSYAF